MIQINNLSKIINKRKILNNINIDLPSNGIVVLSGENGSGKTTLLNIIGMMDDNYDGDIVLNGINYKSLNESEQSLYREQFFSYCFQKNNLVSFLNVSQNRNLDNLLKNENFDSIERQNISNLSQGQQQSLALFHLLKKGKKVYLLDEVTACLDVNNKKALIEKIKELSKEALIIIVSHDLELKNIANQIIILKKGEIVENNNINLYDLNDENYELKNESKFPWSIFLSYLKSVSKITMFSFFINLILTSFLFVGLLGVASEPKEALSGVINDIDYLTTVVSGHINDQDLIQSYSDNCKLFILGNIKSDDNSDIKSSVEIFLDDSVGCDYVYLNNDYHNKLEMYEREYEINDNYVSFVYNFYFYKFKLKINDDIKDNGLYINPNFLKGSSDYVPSVRINNGFWDTNKHYASYYHRYSSHKSPDGEMYGEPEYVSVSYAKELYGFEVRESINDNILYIFDDRLYTDRITYFERQPERSMDMEFNYNLAKKFPDGIRVVLLSSNYPSPNNWNTNYIIVSDNTFNKIIEDKPKYDGICISFLKDKGNLINFVSDKNIKLKTSEYIYYENWSSKQDIDDMLKAYNNIIDYRCNFKNTFWCRVLLCGIPLIFLVFQMTVSYFINYGEKQNNRILKRMGMKSNYRFLMFNIPFIFCVILSVIVGFNIGLSMINPMQVFGFVPNFTFIDFVVSLLIVLSTILIHYVIFNWSEKYE